MLNLLPIPSMHDPFLRITQLYLSRSDLPSEVLVGVTAPSAIMGYLVVVSLLLVTVTGPRFVLGPRSSDRLMPLCSIDSGVPALQNQLPQTPPPPVVALSRRLLLASFLAASSTGVEPKRQLGQDPSLSHWRTAGGGWDGRGEDGMNGWKRRRHQVLCFFFFTYICLLILLNPTMFLHSSVPPCRILHID